MIATLPDRHLRGLGSCVTMDCGGPCPYSASGYGYCFSPTVDGVALPWSGPFGGTETTGNSGFDWAQPTLVSPSGLIQVQITGAAIYRDVLLSRGDNNGAIAFQYQPVGTTDDKGNFTYSAQVTPGSWFERFDIGGTPIGSYGYTTTGEGMNLTVAQYAANTGQAPLPKQVYNVPAGSGPIFTGYSTSPVAVASTPRFLGPPILSTASVSTPSSVTPDSLAPATTGPLFQGYSPVAVQSPVLTTQGGQTSPSPTVTDSGTTDGTSTTVLLAAAALAAYFVLVK